MRTLRGSAFDDRLSGDERRNEISGESGDDELLGAGLGGDDTLQGLDGSDLLCGGDGNDTHEAGAVTERLPTELTRQFRALARSAGVTPIRLHDTRHTWATLALQAAAPAKVVSEILGHANISSTLDTYSHAIPSMQEDREPGGSSRLRPMRRRSGSRTL